MSGRDAVVIQTREPTRAQYGCRCISAISYGSVAGKLEILVHRNGSRFAGFHVKTLQYGVDVGSLIDRNASIHPVTDYFESEKSADRSQEGDFK
jgi:hypothetical protein